MKINRKFSIIFTIVVPISIVAATAPSKAPEEHYTNLKVLPKNIAPKVLKKIMINDFEDGLGIACNFCHAQGKEVGELDFASDAKPEKEIARAMMRMTLGINKKYLEIRHPVIGSDEMVVTCNTCHNGVAFPDGNK